MKRNLSILSFSVLGIVCITESSVIYNSQLRANIDIYIHIYVYLSLTLSLSLLPPLFFFGGVKWFFSVVVEGKEACRLRDFSSVFETPFP